MGQSMSLLLTRLRRGLVTNKETCVNKNNEEVLGCLLIRTSLRDATRPISEQQRGADKTTILKLYVMICLLVQLIFSVACEQLLNSIRDKRQLKNYLTCFLFSFSSSDTRTTLGGYVLLSMLRPSKVYTILDGSSPSAQWKYFALLHCLSFFTAKPVGGHIIFIHTSAHYVYIPAQTAFSDFLLSSIHFRMSVLYFNLHCMHFLLIALLISHHKIHTAPPQLALYGVFSSSLAQEICNSRRNRNILPHRKI